MSVRGRGGFNPKVMLALVLFGAAAFIMTLYFIGAGETGSRGNDGRAHAAANGLNGYAGLARMMELEGFTVRKARNKAALRTDGLLVLTPLQYAEADDISTILQDRAYIGPTLVIVPKWSAGMLPKSDKVKTEKGWVELYGTMVPEWAAELDLPFAVNLEKKESKRAARWSGFGISGSLPAKESLFAEKYEDQRALVMDASANPLAISIVPDEEDEDYATETVVIVVEPDLMNNYGLADGARAELARRIVLEAMDGRHMDVTFDLTMAGFGGTTNLLTLAFRPPFLAATLCLILALFIVGWRAFLRFGPPAAEAEAIAAGKKQLVTNGAGLILRARRLRLLAEPYIALSARRIGQRMGLVRTDPQHIDDALDRHLPGETPFTTRAAQLRKARGAGEILRAAGALKELERKLER